jgi:hypothetical protein
MVKWKGCHSKKSKWVKPTHLNLLLEMIEKFEHERDHEMGNKKMRKKKSNKSM